MNNSGTFGDAILSEDQASNLAIALESIRESVQAASEQWASISQRQSDLISSIEKKVSTLSERVRSTEDKLFMIIGNGDGGTGSLNELRKGQDQMQTQLHEVQSTMRLIEERTRGEAKTSEKAKSFMDGWRGVFIAIGVFGTFASLLSVVASLIYMFVRMNVR
jgi:chromosome segregation ATPase